MSSKLGPLLVVAATVVLNMSSAIVLKELADDPEPGLSFLALGLAIVVLINAFRVVVWGYAHSRYPLSKTYPLTSVFFPMMLLLAHFYGDPISARQLIGTVLITLGVFWVTMRVEH